MELLTATEVNMGLVLTKRLIPQAIRPETLVSPYDKMLKRILEQGLSQDTMNDLAIEFGPQLINSALDAVKHINGLGELADWPKILEESAAMYTAGVNLEKAGKKLQEGNPIDWAKISSLARATQMRMASNMIPLSQISPGEVPFVKIGWKAVDAHTGGVPEVGLVVVGGRPGVGKTWFMVQTVTQYAKTHKKKNLAVFSLEMILEEVANRFKGEGIVESRRPDEAEQARIYMCDKMLTAEEIVQYCATIPDLGLVCIDFADLTIRGVADESSMSILYRTLASAAKELHCTIILLSQLSRRQGIPKPSDLRWCIPETQRVLDAQSGEWRSSKGFDSIVLALTQDGLHPTQGKGYENEIQPILEVKSISGFCLRCSPGHPFWTENGWKKAEELISGDLIAVVRTTHPATCVSYSPHRAKMLGYMIGDGYMPERSKGGISWSEQDGELIKDFHTCFIQEFPECEMKVYQHTRDRGKVMSFVRKEGKCGEPNEFGLWLESLGMRGQNSFTFRIPSVVYTWDDNCVGNFIAGMVAADGTINNYGIKYYSKSPKLLLDLKLLLTRFSIISRISKDELTIKSFSSLQRFHASIPLPGEKGRKLSHLLERKRSMQLCHDVSDILPIQYAQLAQKIDSSIISGRRITRSRFQHLQEFITLPSEMMAGMSNDIWWDTIRSVESRPAEMTYDMVVPGPENFVVEGFITHNTGLAEALGWMILTLYNPATDWSGNDDGEKTNPLPVIEDSAYIIVWKVRGGFREHLEDSPGAICIPFKGKFGWHLEKSKWFTLRNYER